MNSNELGLTIYVIGTALSTIILWCEEFQKKKVNVGNLLMGIVCSSVMWYIIVLGFLMQYEFKNPFHKEPK
jgi:uncharacterized membrane protein